jgi:hypothetical protein
MSAQVIVEMSVRDAEQVRAWQRARQGIQQTGDELDRVAAKGKKAGRDTEAGFSSVLPTLGRVVGAITGIGTAIAGVKKFADLIKQEYEEMLAKQAAAAASQMGISSSLRAATGTFIGRHDAPSVNEFQRRMVAGANGVDINDMLQSFTGAMGSAGDIPINSVMEATLASARLRPDLNREDRQNLVRSSVMLAKEFSQPLEQTMAAVIQSTAQDATETMGDFAKNVVPTAILARGYGSNKDSYKSIMADLSGIGLRAGDPHGRRASTAYLNALKTIKEETLASGLVGPDASIEEQLAAARGDKKIQEKALGVFAEGLGIDPKKALSLHRRNQLAKLGSGDLGGEARTFMAGVEFLSSNQDPATNRFARDRATVFSQSMGISPEAVRAVETLNKQFAASDIGKTERISRADTQSENELLLNSAVGQRGALLKFQANKLSQMGIPLFDRGLTEFEATMQSDENLPEFVRSNLRTVAKKIQKGDPSGFANFVDTDQDRRNAEKIEKLTESIEKMLNAMQDDKVQKVDVINRTNQPAATPAGNLGGGAEQGIRRGNL